MEHRILGLHHITAIADDAKRNHWFYTTVLGQRMVKKTVNFDDPGTYHFYFGDEIGTPGTIITFFPWEGVGAGAIGTGMATDIGYSIDPGTFDFWIERFRHFNVPHNVIEEKFGEQFLAFRDADGLKLELVVPGRQDVRKGWVAADIPQQSVIKGFHNVTLTVTSIGPTANVLTEILGYTLSKEEKNRYRFVTDAIETASIVDVVEAPGFARGRNAAGTNHHIAFRVKNEDTLMEFREKIERMGLNITGKIDRDYFFSVYFREPGGVLFELATDNPGFTKDEPLEQLGSNLKLPKQYESSRDQIEKVLPALK